MIYIGVFLGDLGGVGGYDGFASRWLYEKINFQPGNDLLFQLAEKVSVIALALGLMLMLVFVGCVIHMILRKVKSSVTNS